MLDVAIEVAIFDFDGVVIDSSNDICNAVNYVLGSYGLSSLPKEKIIGFVGLGAKKLLRLCFAESESLTHANSTAFDIETIYPQYLAYYMTHSSDESILYFGLKDTLSQLKECGIRCAIMTNKPEALTKRICRQMDIEEYFELIIGPESVDKMKPDPEGISLILKSFETHALKALMVGDSDSDVVAGRNAGTWTCGVTYGLGDYGKLVATKPDFMVDQIGEVLGIFHKF